ncbi:hypothetical protein [Virgibacillus doumboii]|uniref:hypothetical protein n=1 Tax=Virgibacillus doumboii TaxID=2697503 RepID=UPI0013E0C362|nr:hypothetical protein [Virgibacillus doumboii]
MTIITPIIIVFVISFLLLFIWIFKGEKEEIKKKKGKVFAAIAAAFILGLAPTVVIALLLFALFGSTNIANTMFSLDVNTSKLMLLTVVLVIYLYTVDSFFSVLIQHITGKGKDIFYHIAILLIRILAFYTIGLIIGLSQTSNFIIAVVASCIIFFIDNLKGKNKAKESSG